MIRLVKQFFEYQKLFFHYTGWRLPILYALIAIGGVVEALGIVTLLPLLNVMLGEQADNPLSRFIAGMLDSAGIEVTLANLLLVIVAIFTLRGVITYIYGYFTAYITVSVRRDVQVSFTQRFCDMSFPYYSSRTAGWFNNIIVNEINRFISALRTMCRLSVNAINTLILLPLVLSLRLELTLAVFALGGLVLWLVKGFIRRSVEWSHEQTRDSGQLNSEFIQLIQAFIYLKSTNSMDAVNQHVIGTIGRLADVALRLQHAAVSIAAIREPVAVAVLASFIYIEVGILGGSIPEIMIVAMLLYRTLIQLVALAPQLQTFGQMMGSVHIISNVTRELDDHTESSGEQKQVRLDKPIVFDDVGFSHGDKQILFDLNVTIHQNQTIGIVGASGAGKTTFFHLLTGLLEPNSGEISIGGISYKDINQKSLRDRIGYVTQDPIIFNDTVANNISMWRCKNNDEACQERIRAAARTARCDEFVSAMSNGYDSALGERGIKLSGGERQRIAIAREVFKNPELLIFDEAASALDAESEGFVQESIDRMHGKRTIVVISHRLASVRHCDLIYVFDSGKIVERGPFKKLYTAKKSYFRRLCDQQGVSI